MKKGKREEGREGKRERERDWSRIRDLRDRTTTSICTIKRS